MSPFGLQSRKNVRVSMKVWRVADPAFIASEITRQSSTNIEKVDSPFQMIELSLPV
jgi:hypothetical protein